MYTVILSLHETCAAFKMNIVYLEIFFFLSEILCRKLEEDMRIASEARSCTGVLGIHPRARDIKIDNFSITFHGSEMLQDTRLELNCGRR